jgi:hypothetical protein
MEFNITVLPKKSRRDVAEKKTSEALSGVQAAMVRMMERPEDYSSINNDSEANTLKIRKSLLGFRAEPITRHWRLIWSQDDDTKFLQHGFARRIGGVRGHRASWGFQKGRSCHDCCESHLTYWGIQKPGELSFVSMDVENFFPSITQAMIEEAMDRHGFPATEIDKCINVCTMELTSDIVWNRIIERLAESTSRGGTGVSSETTLRGMFGGVTGRTPMFDFASSVVQTGKWKGIEFGPEPIKLVRELVFRYICGFGRDTRMYDRILIQGSPASPALSNLVAKRADYRLDAMAKARGAFYSRYADDVTFSWQQRHGKKWIGLLAYSASKILQEHGFYIRPDKTIIKGPGMRQSMLGYNLNSGKVTVSRNRRHRVHHQLKKLACGELEINSHALESLMGEVEFIATAHPEVAKDMRSLGREAMVRAGTSGRVCLHFDNQNVHEADLEHESRPIQLW